MARTCGNCGTDLEDLGEGKHYCPNCDETFTINKGKQMVAKPKKNVLEQIKDKIKQQDEEIAKLRKTQEQDDFFGLERENVDGE